MHAVSVGCAVVVGAVLIFAGGSKIASGRRWPADAQSLGAPQWATPFVPWVELAVGALLASQVARPAIAYVAIALFVVFSLLILRQLRRGEHPSCACFGSWSAKPLSGIHVLRNALLIVMSVLAALG